MKKRDRTVVMVSLVLGVLVGLGCDEGESSAKASGEGASAAAAAQADAARVEVEVNASGYSPDRVEAKAGEPLTLVFTRTAEEGCGTDIVIPDMDVERDLPLNEAVAVTITPEEAGEMRFTCGMDMFDGAIVVR
jgi:plastocyanin domain-containing protein